MAKDFGFAAPVAEDITKVAAGVGGAVMAGVVEGVAVKMAPMMGAAAPLLSWGTLLITPLIGIGGALVSRGMIGDLFQGVAAGGSAILGYTLPSMLVPTLFGKKAGQLSAEQRAALAARSEVKSLPAGPGNAPQRTQSMASIGVDF